AAAQGTEPETSIRLFEHIDRPLDLLQVRARVHAMTRGPGLASAAFPGRVADDPLAGIETIADLHQQLWIRAVVAVPRQHLILDPGEEQIELLALGGELRSEHHLRPKDLVRLDYADVAVAV